MDLQGVEIVYTICFVLGLGFAVLTALLSGFLGGFDTGIDVGGHHGATVDHGHHHFSPWNPIVIAMFLVSFGGAGMISKNYFGLALPGQLAVSGSAGFAVGGLVFWAIWKLFSAAQGSSEVHLEELVGQEAEVTVSIPSAGMGQIAYVSGGRHVGVAVSVDGEPIPEGSVVKISKIAGSTFYVERVP